jgi:hypothetical protein
MASVTPHVRKHLSADVRFRVVRRGFAAIPDSRGAEGDISLTDTLLSASLNLEQFVARQY